MCTKYGQNSDLKEKLKDKFKCQLTEKHMHTYYSNNTPPKKYG